MQPMAGGCKTCTAMSGNGVWTLGTILIGGHRRMAAPGRQAEEQPGCCAAGRGAATPRVAVRPTATTSPRSTAAASSVSASVASPRTNSLPLNPLFLYPLAVGAEGASFFSTTWPSSEDNLLSASGLAQLSNNACLRCRTLAYGYWHQWRRIRPNACSPIAVCAALLSWLGRFWAGSAADPKQIKQAYRPDQ